MFAESYQIVQEHYDMSGHVYRIISVKGIELSSIFFLQFAQILEYIFPSNFVIWLFQASLDKFVEFYLIISNHIASIRIASNRIIVGNNLEFWKSYLIVLFLIARLARSDPRNSFLCCPCIFIFVLAFSFLSLHFVPFPQFRTSLDMFENHIES